MFNDYPLRCSTLSYKNDCGHNFPSNIHNISIDDDHQINYTI